MKIDGMNPDAHITNYRKPVVAYLTNCYAPPDQVSVGPATRHYYHAKGIADAGLDVEVVTASTSTVSNSILACDSPIDGISVRRISAAAVLVDSIAARVGYHFKYFFRSISIVLGIQHPQLVVASIPSLPIGWQGYFIARIRKSKLLIDVRDLWSDSLSTTKLARIPLFVALNRIAEKLLYKSADVITCTSCAQAEEIRGMVGGTQEIRIVPNGLDPELKETGNQIHPLIHEIKRKYGRIGIFAGKHTRYAALEILLMAAKELENDDFALLLVGGGYTKQGLIQRVKVEGVKNVFFHDPVPKKEIASFLLGADIFFINYSKERAWKNVLPNKIFDYMYYNKPIVASVVPGEITRVIAESGAGINVTPEQPIEIARAVRECFGRNGQKFSPKNYLLEHFDRKNTVAMFVAAVNSLMNRSVDNTQPSRAIRFLERS